MALISCICMKYLTASMSRSMQIVSIISIKYIEYKTLLYSKTFEKDVGQNHKKLSKLNNPDR
jgi:hypothetical protein